MAPGDTPEGTEEKPGVVRLIGSLNSIQTRGPSSQLYTFIRDEKTEVLPGDWAWFAELGNDFKFEVILEPGPSVQPDTESQN